MDAIRQKPSTSDGGLHISVVLPDIRDPGVRVRTEDFTRVFAKFLVDTWRRERGLKVE